MPGLDPGIHAFVSRSEDVDGRDKHGHDDSETSGTICRKPQH